MIARGREREIEKCEREVGREKEREREIAKIICVSDRLNDIAQSHVNMEMKVRAPKLTIERSAAHRGW